jgi:hypothetical protein
MFYAEARGLYSVARRMREFAANPHGDPAFWTLAPFLVRAADVGSFDGVKRAARAKPKRAAAKPVAVKRVAAKRVAAKSARVAARRKPAATGRRAGKPNKSRRSRS